MIRRICIAIIRLYQRTISPDHGWLRAFPFLGCRYYPSCSEYTIRAIHRYGVFFGCIRGCWRILRCNPFSKGGVDEI